MLTRRALLALGLLGVGALFGAGGCGDGGKARAITGVNVELQVVDWNSIDQQVSTMLQSNQPPDVLNLNSFSSYAKDGLLYSADEVLSQKTREDFLDAFARGGEYQGKLYGFPILS